MLSYFQQNNFRIIRPYQDTHRHQAVVDPHQSPCQRVYNTDVDGDDAAMYEKPLCMLPYEKLRNIQTACFKTWKRALTRTPEMRQSARKTSPQPRRPSLPYLTFPRQVHIRPVLRPGPSVVVRPLEVQRFSPRRQGHSRLLPQ